MKKSKLLMLTVTVISIAILVVASIFSVSATPSDADIFSPSREVFNTWGFGTVEDGIPWTGDTYLYPSYEVDLHGNLNFEKGLEGWIVNNPAHGKLKVDSNGNKCITMITDKSYQSIRTAMFPISKVKEGSRATVMYKWRGEAHAIQVLLHEFYEVKRYPTGQILRKTSRIGSDGSMQLWASDEENPEDWNIAFEYNKNPANKLTEESDTDKVYYSISAESMANPELTNGMDLDDFQIVIHNDEERKIRDLDGNVLYDLNNLPKRQDPDYIFTGDKKKDENAKIKVDLDKLLANGANSVEKQDDKKPSNSDVDNSGVIEEDKGNVLVWVIVALGAVLILAAAVIVFIIIKKKKANSIADTQSEVLTEPEQKDEA